MKIVLLITTLMVTSMFAYTQKDIEKNYNLCLEFEGDVDPKNPQINFEDCDKWIDLYEHMDFYKTGNQDYLVSPIGYYTDLFEHKKRVVTTNTLGEEDIKFEKVAKLEFERKTKGQVDNYVIKEASVYLTDLYNYEINNFLLTDPFYLNGLAKKDRFQLKADRDVEARVLSEYVSEGILPATFTILITDMTDKNRKTKYEIDTLSLLKHIQKFYSVHKSIDSLMKRDMAFNSFLIWKGYDRTSLQSKHRMLDLIFLYKMSLKKDKEAMRFLNFVSTAQYDAAAKYLMSIPDVKAIYDGIHNKDENIKKLENWMRGY